MKKTLILSGVALGALMLALAPASAQSINLLGGSDNGGATVTVGGGDSGIDVDADVDADNLLGGGDDNSLLGTNEILDINGNGILDTNEGASVNLFGPGDDGATQLAVGTDNDDDVLVTLFGQPGAGDADGSDIARANILPNGLNGGEGDDVAASLFGGTDATVDLFGPGAGNGGDGGAGGAGAGGGGIDPTETGSIPGGGNGAGPGAGNGAGNGSNSAVRVASASNASLRANTDGCFTPDPSQIAHLIARGTYSADVTARWQSADNVSLIPVKLCADARAQLEAAVTADPNMGAMRAAVAMNTKITSRIGPQYQADDVLAVDQSGSDLTVYVY